MTTRDQDMTPERDLEAMSEAELRAEFERDLEAGAESAAKQIAEMPATGTDGASLTAITGGKTLPADKEKGHSDIELRDAILNDGVLYGHGQDTWRTYEDGLWSEIEEDTAKAHAMRVCERLVGPKTTMHRVGGVTGLVRLSVTVPRGRWDGDMNLLPLRNGVLDTRMLTLAPNAPENYITDRVEYDYDSAATAPNWEFFLSEFCEPEKVAWLQEFAGYCLTPETKHEVIGWLVGERGGGHSTFTLGLETMLGHRAGVLGLRELERNDFALSQVPGKTLLTAVEQPDDYMTTTDILNKLSSGDKVNINEKKSESLQVHAGCEATMEHE